jgi:L-fuculose-phosphate aldolase
MKPEWRSTAEQVCAIARKAEAAGLVAGSSGNVSARIPNTADLVAITPSSVLYEVMRPEDIIIIDLQGHVVEGGLRASSETPFHTLLYREFGTMGAVVHTQSPYATAFSVVRRPIPLITTEGFCVGAAQVDVSEYALPGTADLARVVLEGFKRQPGSRALLLANHGLIAMGKDLAEAFKVAQNVELEAKVFSIALSLGTPVILPPEVLEQIKKRYAAASIPTNGG